MLTTAGAEVTTTAEAGAELLVTMPGNTELTAATEGARLGADVSMLSCAARGAIGAASEGPSLTVMRTVPEGPGTGMARA